MIEAPSLPISPSCSSSQTPVRPPALTCATPGSQSSTKSGHDLDPESYGDFVKEVGTDWRGSAPTQAQFIERRVAENGHRAAGPGGVVAGGIPDAFEACPGKGLSPRLSGTVVEAGADFLSQAKLPDHMGIRHIGKVQLLGDTRLADEFRCDQIARYKPEVAKDLDEGAFRSRRQIARTGFVDVDQIKATIARRAEVPRMVDGTMDPEERAGEVVYRELIEAGRRRDERRTHCARRAAECRAAASTSYSYSGSSFANSSAGVLPRNSV